VIIAVLAAIFVAYIFQSLELTLFSVSLLPVGYVVAYSALKKDEPWLSGLLATLASAFSLFLFFSVLMVNSEVSFLLALSESLNSGIDEALRQYRNTESMSSENYLLLEQTLTQMRSVAPLIMPAILGSLLLLMGWMTLLLGNLIMPKLGVAAPWTEYKYWQLPERFIWILIASAIFAILPGQTTRLLGINCLILVSLPYAFQGLSITVFLLSKWNVPRIVRTLIYVLIFLQSFGTILLIILGIADVWFNIRRLNTEPADNEVDTK